MNLHFKDVQELKHDGVNGVGIVLQRFLADVEDEFENVSAQIQILMLQQRVVYMMPHTRFDWRVVYYVSHKDGHKDLIFVLDPTKVKLTSHESIVQLCNSLEQCASLYDWCDMYKIPHLQV